MSTKNVSVRILLSSTAEKLSAVLGEFALPYAERILTHILGCSRSALYLPQNATIPDEKYAEVDSIVARCRTHEPLDYIFGTSYFFDREFIVTPEVLLPRPDTELIVEQVLRHETEQELFFAEIGVGSGIISLILSEKRVGWRGIGTDISREACMVSRKNRRNTRVCLLCTDMLSSVVPKKNFDFIVSNPPYIPSDAIATLDFSVNGFEPAVALDGGIDGLDFFRKLADTGALYLKKGGALYCEFGFDQEEQMREIFTGDTWGDREIFHDLSGHPRVVYIRCII